MPAFVVDSAALSRNIEKLRRFTAAQIIAVVKGNGYGLGLVPYARFLTAQGVALLAVSTNDGLGASGENIARLMQRKHYYFVPYGQDDAAQKPQSLKADLTLLPAALEAALHGQQLQPVLREWN